MSVNRKRARYRRKREKVKQEKRAHEALLRQAERSFELEHFNRTWRMPVTGRWSSSKSNISEIPRGMTKLVAVLDDVMATAVRGRLRGST